MIDQTESRSTGPRGVRTLLVVLLLAAVYAGYLPALDGEMQFDDLRAVANNSGIKDLANFGRWVRGDVLGASRPLPDLTFALDYRAGGLAVRPYHLTNLAMHLAAVLAVLALSLAILKRLEWPWPFATAYVVAALFGLHPLQSHAVAYICQRAEVLAALFYLLAVRMMLAAEDRARSRAAAGWIAGALACALLGWMTKPTLATLPAALLLCWAAFPRAGVSWRARLAASLPFWALTAWFSSRLLTSVRGSGAAGFDLPQLGAGRYLLTQSRVILTYLRLLFWPAGQNADWDFPPSTSVFEPRTLLALLVLAALVAAAAWLWRWSSRPRQDGELRALARMGAFGLFWFLGVLAPTSSIIPVADVIEEYRTYLASWGIFLPAAAAGVLAVRRAVPGPRAAAAGALLAVAVCLALGVALHRRAAVWATGVSLWSDVVAKSPGKPRAHMNLGYALTPSDPARALSEYRIALRLADHTIRRAELLQDMAGALLALHQYDEAIRILRDLLASGPPSPQLQTNLAIACLESGRIDEAREAAERAAREFPLYAPAHHTLGQLAFIRGDYATAKLEFGKAVALDPDALSSLSSLAVTQEKAGDRQGACASWARYARSPSAQSDAALQRLADLGCPQP